MYDIIFQEKEYERAMNKKIFICLVLAVMISDYELNEEKAKATLQKFIDAFD